MSVRIYEVVDDWLCYEKVRELRWSEGVRCPHCKSLSHRRNGHHNSTEHRLRYQCKDCNRCYDDLTGTIFEGHHQPLKVWILCLYLMGLNLSNAQIARELGLAESDVHQMSSELREGIYEKRPAVMLSGAVEADELYVIAGHKGQPEMVKKGRQPWRRRLKGKRGWGTAAGDKPPVLGLIARSGLVRIWMLEDARAKDD